MNIDNDYRLADAIVDNWKAQGNAQFWTGNLQDFFVEVMQTLNLAPMYRYSLCSYMLDKLSERYSDTEKVDIGTLVVDENSYLQYLISEWDYKYKDAYVYHQESLDEIVDISSTIFSKIIKYLEGRDNSYKLLRLDLEMAKMHLCELLGEVVNEIYYPTARSEADYEYSESTKDIDMIRLFFTESTPLSRRIKTYISMLDDKKRQAMILRLKCLGCMSTSLRDALFEPKQATAC